MSDENKHGSASQMPVRRVRKIPVMAPTVRIQSGCSKEIQINSKPISCVHTGLPTRNLIGKMLKKPILSESRQNQARSKDFRSLEKREKMEISKSAPDLSRLNRFVRPETGSSVLSVAGNLKKIESLENVMENIRKAPSREKDGNGRVQIGSSRVSAKSGTMGKLKRIEMGGKKSMADKSRSVKPVENKRKLNSDPEINRKKNHAEPETNSIGFPESLSVDSRTEECKKVVKKIMLDKKILDSGEKKRNSAELEDSLGTFNSDEMANLLSNEFLLKHLESAKSLSGETDKSSKRNSSEFEDSVGSFFSDQMITNLCKSNEFLNPISSKQNFFGENPLGLSISEDLDNLTPGLLGLSNSIDRTPSAEDLPMECEAEPEVDTTIVPPAEAAAASARSGSPTEELPQESMSSRTPNAPASILTSITSIMSLDTGYQGDGELSRPESRNTENESRFLKLPTAENGIPVKSINFDDGKTMTDSDFFTESDADVHDDLSAAAAEIGSGKGDRKARVIDGTLYGGAYIQAHAAIHHELENNPAGVIPAKHQPISSANNSNEDMESSGIYSDLEKKPEEIWPGREKESVSYLGMIAEQLKTIQNVAASSAAEKRSHQVTPPSEGIIKSSSGDSSSTVHEMISSVVASPTCGKSIESAIPDGKDLPPAKKSKVPNRNATSKIKALIEKPIKEREPRSKTIKKGKWDEVMDKIAQGKEEKKYSPSKFRNVKSKVFQNVGPIYNSRRNEPETKTMTRTTPNNSPVVLKSRSRRSTRIRSSESSLVSPKSKQSRTSTSPNSSQRSSLSDISLSENLHQKSVNRTGSKKRDLISPQSNESTNSTNTPTRKLNNNDDTLSKGNRLRSSPCRNSDLQNGNVFRTPSGTTLATMKTPSVRKAPASKKGDAMGPTIHRTASVPFKHSNHNGIVAKSASGVILNTTPTNNNNTTIANNNNSNNNVVKSVQAFQNKPLKSSTLALNPVQIKNGCLNGATKETNKALMKQLKHNSRAFESLAILFSYCVNDLDAFSMPDVKRKLETETNKFVQAQIDLKELESRLNRVREELNEKELAIIELNKDKVNLGEQSENFRKLVEELKNKLEVVTEEKCEAESELLRESENARRLNGELIERSEKYEMEKDNLSCRLSEAKKENGVLKSANREMKEEYDKCLQENRKLVDLISKRQNEVIRGGKENSEGENENGRKTGSRRDISPDRNQVATTIKSEKSFHRSPSVPAPSPINSKCLESEVESLRQVLALKTDEVTELRRQEMSLRENADRVPKLLSTITMLEGKVEDLQSQLSSQTETVRDLFKSNEHLEEELKTVNIQKTRLSHKNEELQYKLKQYAEAMKQLATQKNLSEKDLKADFSPAKSNCRKPGDSGDQDESVNPHMKAVVEKSDSVSYMLEMTEDSSQIVTNIIRRAESLRSTNREREQVLARKKKSTKGSSAAAAAGAAATSPPSSMEIPSTKLKFSPDSGDFQPEVASTPFPGNDPDIEGSPVSPGKNSPPISPVRRRVFPPNKIPVKLNRSDFSTDSIELANEDCEIIEITKSFDESDKNGEMVSSTSSSSSSSSASTSSNGSHFDIESDVLSNFAENERNFRSDLDVEEDTEETEENSEANNESIVVTYQRNGTTETVKSVLPVYDDLQAEEENHDFLPEESQNFKNPFLSSAKNFVRIPKISGGEAMIGLSSEEDDEEGEDIEKIQMIYKE